MTNRPRLVMLSFLVLIAGISVERAAADRTNFLVVLCDDLGYGDLGCYGHPIIKTPHIDHLAAEGLRLTDCYAAAANCSPARTGLMTGRTPYRVGIHDWIPMHSPMHVRREETTIASILQQAGYATCHVGKWHLNGRFNLPDQPQPNDHGFDWWFSTQNNALPNHRRPRNFVRNGKPVGQLRGYSAQIVADEAIAWLTHHRDRSKPFFLYVCFHEPHEPIATDERFRKMYDDTDEPYEPSRVAHHGNISQLDDALGRLLAAVDTLDLRQETLLFFTSDNGPAITRRHPWGSSGPLREKKGSMYEGGIRVPGIIRWPGHTRPGTASDEPVSGVDLLPTLCEVAGVRVPADRAIDGASILPVLSGQSIRRHRPLYWQYNRAISGPKVALRIGDWKILAELEGVGRWPGADITDAAQRSIKTARIGKFELYNLRQDIGEMNDLAIVEHERLSSMSDELRRMFAEVQAESPTWPAWTSPRYESQQIEWPDYSLPRRRQ